MSETPTNETANGDAVDNRAETNRANAQNSTGPRTETGKQRSSLNALRHGPTGQTIVLPSADLAAYQKHCKEFFDEYRPKNKTETHLLQTMADLSWRLNRASSIETNLLALGGARQSISVRGQRQVHTALAMAQAFHERPKPWRTSACTSIAWPPASTRR